MRWIGNLLLLLLLHSLSESKAKRRKREAKDTVDPLLSLVFNTPEIKHESKIKDTRPDRAISPDEELAALLDAVGKQNYKHSRSNVQEKRSAVYPQTHLGGVPAESTVLDAMTRSSITGLSAQNTDSVGIGPTYSDSMNTFTRSLMPKPVLNGPQALNPNPQDMENAGLVPRTMPVPAAQPVPFQPMHVASVPDVQSQQTLPGIVAAPLVSFNPVPGSQALVNNTLAKKSDVAVPGSKPFNDQQDLTYFMPDDKKSSIPIPVRTESSEVVMNKDSEPIQLRVISPNMKLRGVVPHNPEYGETVESIAKADEMLRRSGIFRPVYLPKIIHPVKKSSIPRPKDMTKTKTDTDQRSTIPFLTQPLAPLSVPNGQPYSNYQQSPPLQYASAATYSNGKPTTVNTFSKPEYIQQFQLEQSGMHAKPKDIAADECADQYPGQCLEFAKNFYCTKFVDLMRIQCRKSCHFCNQEKEAPAGETVGKQEPVKEGVSSGSGSGSGGMASGSGEEDTEGYSSRMETNKSRKNQILYLPELGSGSGGSGSGTGESHAQHQQVKTNEKSQPKEAKKKAKVPDSVKAEAITITKTPSQNFQVPATKNKEEAVAKKSVNVGGNVTKKSVIPQVAIVHEYSKVMPVEAAGSDHEESSGSGSASGDGSGSGSSSGSGERETESAKATPTKVKATVTVKKKANFTKKATIPKAPQDFLKRLGNYPKIDLKVIAAALAKYEEAALQMAAEYPHYMESNVAEVERSSIPKPEIVGNVKVEKMKQDIQVAKLSMQEHSKRFEIPKYLIVGEDIHEKGGVAKQPSALEDAASFESVSARFRDAGRNPSLMEFYAETGKTGVEETGERRSRLSRRKKLKPVDPYEYLRNMAPGASMEPIVDPKARSSVPASHSYPLFLMKVAPGSDKYIEAPKTRSTVAAAKPVMHNPLLELQQHFVAPPPAHAVQPQATQANPAADFFAPKPAPVENPIMNGAPFSEQAAAIGSNPSEDQAQFTQIPQANVASVVSQTGVARGPPMQSPEIAAEPFRDFRFGNNFPSPQAAKNPLQTHDEDMTIMASAASLPVGAGNFEKQALALDTPAAAASLLQQTESNVGTMEQANPLRSKMLSAFFNNKHSEEADVESIGSGSGGGGTGGPLLNYLGSSSPDEPGVTRTLNLQNLLSKGAAIKLSLPEKTPVVPQGSSSTYLQTNLDALTPETAAVTSAANNGQSDLTANAIGARVTMSKTQETKWVRPNAEHELASIMPENGNLADVRSDLAADAVQKLLAEALEPQREKAEEDLIKVFGKLSTSLLPRVRDQSSRESLKKRVPNVRPRQPTPPIKDRIHSNRNRLIYQSGNARKITAPTAYKKALSNNVRIQRLNGIRGAVDGRKPMASKPVKLRPSHSTLRAPDEKNGISNTQATKPSSSKKVERPIESLGEEQHQVSRFGLDASHISFPFSATISSSLKRKQDKMLTQIQSAFNTYLDQLDKPGKPSSAIKDPSANLQGGHLQGTKFRVAPGSSHYSHQHGLKKEELGKPLDDQQARLKGISPDRLLFPNDAPHKLPRPITQALPINVNTQQGTFSLPAMTDIDKQIHLNSAIDSALERLSSNSSGIDGEVNNAEVSAAKSILSSLDFRPNQKGQIQEVTPLGKAASLAASKKDLSQSGAYRDLARLTDPRLMPRKRLLPISRGESRVSTMSQHRALHLSNSLEGSWNTKGTAHNFDRDKTSSSQRENHPLYKGLLNGNGSPALSGTDKVNFSSSTSMQSRVGILTPATSSSTQAPMPKSATVSSSPLPVSPPKSGLIVAAHRTLNDASGIKKTVLDNVLSKARNHHYPQPRGKTKAPVSQSLSGSTEKASNSHFYQPLAVSVIKNNRTGNVRLNAEGLSISLREKNPSSSKEDSLDESMPSKTGASKVSVPLASVSKLKGVQPAGQALPGLLSKSTARPGNHIKGYRKHKKHKASLDFSNLSVLQSQLTNVSEALADQILHDMFTTNKGATEKKLHPTPGHHAFTDSINPPSDRQRPLSATSANSVLNQIANKIVQSGFHAPGSTSPPLKRKQVRQMIEPDPGKDEHREQENRERINITLASVYPREAPVSLMTSLSNPLRPSFPNLDTGNPLWPNESFTYPVLSPHFPSRFSSSSFAPSPQATKQAFGTSIGAEPSPVSEETVRQELPTQAENGLIDQQFAALAGFQESRNEKPLIPQTPKVETSVQRDSLPQPALVSGPPAMAQTQNNGAAQVNTDVLVDSSMLRDAASAAAQATPSIGFVTKTDERSDSNLLPNARPSQTPQGTANEINDVAAATFARKANVQIPQNVPSSPQLTTAQASPNANLAAMQDAPLQEVAQEDPLVLSSHDANPMTSAKVGIQTLQTPTDISPSPGVEENSFLPPLIYGGSESQPGMSSSSRGESLPPLNQAPNSATASFSTSQQDFKQSAPSTALIGNSMNPDVSNVAVHQKEASEELTSVKSDQALQQKSAFGNGSPLRGGHPFATPIVQDKRTQLNGKPLIINAFYQKKEVNPPASASPWMQFNIDNSDKQPLNSRDQVQQSLYGHNAYPLAAQETSKLEAYMSGAAYHYDPQQEMRSTTPGKPNLDHIQGPAQGQVQGGGLGQAQGPVQGGGQVQVQGGSQGQAQGQVQRGGQNQGQGQAQVQGQGLNQFQSSEAMAPIGMTSMGPTFEVGTPTEMKSQADAQTYKPVNALRSRSQLMPQIAQVPPEGTSRLVPEAESYNAPHKKNLIKHKPDLDCGEGWDGASGDFGTFCYKKMTVRTTFDDALSECRRLNSDLFSILNAYENRYLQDNINEKFWIGYRDRSMDGAWNWTDNSRSIYTNWGSEADDSTGQRRDCVLLDGDQGKWKDEPCSAVYPYLCKAKKGCPKNWNKLKLESTSGCYRLFKEKKSWEEAEQDCELHNGHLSSILSEEEQTMVFRVHSSKSFWIGYNDKDSEGDWTWSDRATSSYTNWDDRSPNNGGVSCAAMLEGGKWHDEPCSEKLPFICKRKGPKGEKLDGLDESGALKPVSRLMNNSATAPNFIFDEMAKTVSMPVVAVSFWPLLKSSRTGLSGSRPLAIHGAIAEVANGVALDGNASFLDAGDFNGKCVSDTEKCQKGFAIALQVIFDESVKNYKTPHCVVDTAGGGKGFTIYIKDNKLHYKVARSDFVWELATDLITSRWQEIVMSWHRDKGITVYVNGAFKDSISEGKSPGHFDPNALTRLLIGRQSNAKKPYYYTKMIVTSLTFFTKALTIEDVPYAFTFDDTVVANYRWLMPHLTNNLIPGSPAVKSFKEVTDIDGGILIDGDKGWLEVTDYDTCLQDPSNCNHGFALSFKLKFDQQIVREYKEAHYIMDSGGHKNGLKGISVYLVNDNLYFQVIMSPQEDIMIWTVRTPVYTVRWQRVVMTWRLDKGLWVYLDGSFRGLTKTPRTLPILAKEHLNRFVIGRKTVGPDYRGAVFGISSLAIYSRFLTRKDAEKVFGEKDNPFPGLIREVWKNIPGPSLQHLKSNPDYPNNPTNIEIIENFDAPFDVAKDYGSKLKGYFVSPETGNYTFYMSCSKSCELYFSSDEDVRNKTKILQLYKPTWHNQWNKYSNQSSKSIYMVAGKYYFLEAIQKGEENSDTLSVGVRMPSGRYQRPINKENLQWRLQGNPFAGVVREVWYDIPGYEVQDLQNDRNFPENPSSIEVLDKFDAPFNVDDNYGSRLSAFFRAPETGDYRFYLASDSTGELWISSDDSERNLVKVITLNGWTDHNEWLKYSDQKSNKIYLLAGKYYYIRAYQKADKLGDSVSVAVELPSGLFEGPIKRKRLSWKLPNGKTAPGPRDLIEPLPKPVGVYRLNDASLRDVITGDNGMIIHNVDMTPGPGGVKDSAFLFKGKRDSFIEIPNSGTLDTRNAITMLANVFPTGNDGPILNYRKDGWGVHLWQFDKSQLFVRFVTRSNEMTTQPLGTRVLQLNEWNQVGASYDNNTGVAQLWHDGKMVKSRNIGQVDLATQYPIRVGAREGDDRYFRGKISCIQLYDKALTERQIGEVRQCPRKDGQREDPLLALTQTGSGTELANEDSYSIENRVGEDTEEELAANKCDPNPCANSGKCVNDEKKVDGYHCQCTSDFAGKHCQVSKPAARNPNVKRMNIPNYPKKVGTEQYTRVSAKKSSGGPKTAEDERQDIFLLYQRLGCYRDDSNRRDLPRKVPLKAVSQEECVRACALQDKGYAYFGLQNGKDCYCSKKYGRYGKVEDNDCSLRCKDNMEQNCGGKERNLVFFFGLGTNYTIKTYTGKKFGAGTDAKVFVELIGERGSSDFRQLDNKIERFEPGSVDTETLMLPDLGKLKKLRVLHDNSGSAPSWFLDKISVTDEEGETYEFPCNDWLSETQSGGKLERDIDVKTKVPSKS